MARDSFIRGAFFAAIEDAVTADEPVYLVLRREECSYGGPEEGGWWIRDRFVEAYKRFPSRDLAEAAREAVKRLAEQYTTEAADAFNRYCRDSLDAAEARGLFAEDLPEVDGPDRYFVCIEDEVPTDQITENRHYE